MIKGKVFDNHTHSSFSADSNMLLSDAISKAIEIGLSGICISDHMDLVQPSGLRDFSFDIKKQQDAILKEQSIIHNFKILKGIEIGIQDVSFEANKKLLENNHFDSVIFSQHFMDGTDPYHGNYYENYDWKNAYEKYLITLYNNSKKLNDFDILGHFDYIVRYSPWKENITYKSFSDIFDEIFKYLIENGKTFEINTKTYQFYKGKKPVLDINILKRYKELGGDFISLGSDAHTHDRIADKFPAYLNLLYSNGIKYTACYLERKACINPIII